MTVPSYRTYSGSAAALYQDFFVPSIATPVSTHLLRVAELQPGERVLDVACGTGVVALAAADQVGPNGTVTGIDIAPDMIDVARSTAHAQGLEIELHKADATSIPVPDGTQDAVLCQMGLMFMDDQAAVVREMHRTLVPGGRILISTPGRIQAPFRNMEQSIADHIGPELGGFVSMVFSMHDPQTLASLLVDAAFSGVEESEYTADLDMPVPAELLWNYINLTPLGPVVADAPESARQAMEKQMVESTTPDIDGRLRVDQPIALAVGRR